MLRTNEINTQPSWAVEPPPAGSGRRPPQAEDTKSNDKCSDGVLVRKELMKFGGVWWHDTKHKWQSSWTCKNRRCGKKEMSVDVNATTNLINHCKSERCYGQQGLIATLDDLKKGKKQTTIGAFYDRYSVKEKDTHDWVELIVIGNEPISIVESKFWRGKLKCGKTAIGQRKIRQILTCLVVMSCIRVTEN